MASGKSVMAVIRATRPTFRNNHDKIAFAVHATFLASGYALTATGPRALSDTALSNPSTEEVSVDHWNELDREYAFVYVNPEKNSKKVLVKCLVMNDKLLVDALPQGSSVPLHLEINVKDYVGVSGSSIYSRQFRNSEKFVKRLNGDILSKLDDILSKLDGSPYSSLSSNHQSSERSDGIRYSSGRSDRIRQETREIGVKYGESDGPSIHPSGIIFPPVNPSGGSDLLPAPGAGVYPTRGYRGSGSLLVGPNDPRWFGGIDEEPAFPGRPPDVLPGARFDPYGPPGVPGFEPNRFTRNPRRGYDTHPDLEHFRRDAGSDFGDLGHFRGGAGF